MLNHFKEIFKYRELLITFVKKSLDARYKGSFLGFIWTFINHLAHLVVFTIVFQYIFDVGTSNYSMFLFVCLVPWTEFTSAISGSLVSITGNANLVKKIYFPRQLLPLSVSLTYIVDYIYCIPIVLLAMLISKIPFTISLLFLPIIMILQCIFQTGICYIVAALNVKYRDIKQIVGIITMAWVYANPIFYPIERLQSLVILGRTVSDFWLPLLNPISSVVLSYRDMMYFGRMPSIKNILVALISGIIIYIIGYLVFNHFEKTFAEDV